MVAFARCSKATYQIFRDNIKDTRNWYETKCRYGFRLYDEIGYYFVGEGNAQQYFPYRTGDIFKRIYVDPWKRHGREGGPGIRSSWYYVWYKHKWIRLKRITLLAYPMATSDILGRLLIPHKVIRLLEDPLYFYGFMSGIRHPDFAVELKAGQPVAMLHRSKLVMRVKDTVTFGKTKCKYMTQIE